MDYIITPYQTHNEFLEQKPLYIYVFVYRSLISTFVARITTIGYEGQ